jgi:hypothetical protein
MEYFEEFRETCDKLKATFESQLDSQMCFIAAIDLFVAELLGKISDDDKKRLKVYFDSARNGIVGCAETMGGVFNLKIVKPEDIAKKAIEKREQVDTLESWFALDPEKDATIHT